MVSITSWTRLEPRCRDTTLQEGLEGRLHDPLWMLARQWQLGEFAGHDGGTVVDARVRIACAPLSRYRPEEDVEARPYDPRAQPLEVLVESEAPDEAGPGSGDVRAAAEAGLHFARLLNGHDVGHYADAYRERYAIIADEQPSDAARRFLAVMAGRAIDGAGLYAELVDAPRTDDGAVAELPAEPPIDDDDRDAVAAAAGRWLAWYEATHRVPTQPRSAWVPERMTHRFATSAATRHGEVALVATEHPGGRLDWYAFDHAPEVALRDDDGAAEPRVVVAEVLPSRVRYRGMPTQRWWELEDARADFGAVATSPEDLARLLFIELAITYGNDWFLAPVDVDVGSVCEVRSVIVTDAFGQRTLVRHYAEVDGPDGAWRMFGLDAPAEDPAGRMLLVPPVLPASLHGPVVEEVLLRRDGIANLAWAVERVVPDALARPRDRTAAGGTGGTGEAPDATAPYRYRLAADVPEHWFPLVPVRGTEPGDIKLVRGRMHPARDGPAPHPEGAILGPGEPLALFDEDVTRAGARVTRRDEYARWSDGSTHLWRARRRWLGGGEAWSGLRHDIVEPADGS